MQLEENQSWLEGPGAEGPLSSSVCCASARPGGHLREWPALPTCLGLRIMEVATCGCMEITALSCGGFVINKGLGDSFCGNLFLSFYFFFVLFCFLLLFFAFFLILNVPWCEVLESPGCGLAASWGCHLGRLIGIPNLLK